MTHLSKSLAVAALTLAVSLPAAAATMKAVVTGTVYDSLDRTGVFGPAGESFDGQSVTVTYIFDPALAGDRDKLPGRYDTAYGGASYNFVETPAVSTKVQVGAVSFSIDPGYLDYFQTYDSSLVGYDFWYVQSIENSFDPLTGEGSQNSVHSYFYDYVDDLVPGDLEAPFDWSYDGASSDFIYGFLQRYQSNPFEGLTEHAYGNFYIDRVVVTRLDDVAPIPLPASALLLLGALGGIAALRRRRG